MRTRRYALSAAGLLAAIAISAGAWASWQAEPRTSTQSVASDSVYARLGAGLENVALTNQNGARVAWTALNGRPRVLFFGFTHCPQVCPMTMAALQAAMAEAAIGESALHIDFVSLDPARDTPEYLNDYLAGFGQNVRGFTGAMEEVTRVAHAYRASFTRANLGNGDYTIDHSTGIYFIDADGRVVAVMSYDSTPTEIAGALRKLVAA